jgi:Spy/CpxP family protein refolding chaperone
MKILDLWKQQDLTDESRARLRELIDVQRYQPDDHLQRETLLETFLETLTETQLAVFARLLREMTGRVH